MRSVTKFGALLLALCLSLPALAMSLDEAKEQLDSAKQQGLVGETPSGYLAVVQADGNARAIVDAINEARRSEYSRIAGKHGIPVGEVEVVAGKKAVEKTPAGQFIRVGDKWVRK
ncbi:YdbL family protein [Marinobacter sediminum]|uniref:YdbL family protein n=1 Tax=Marinobacter sediminum TaxID=256323 RepID=UPI00202FA8FE|nr:YdbL family protein [Marinobacter sediminum]MCM0611293.1 YdbL family protein [Marinobacter sediminum]